MEKRKKVDLFVESDQEDDLSFKTNKNYAKHYDEFRKKELLSHLKNLSEDDDSSSSDDASTDDEVLNPEFDKEFFKTLAYLKSKNPGKYENIPTFFENVATIENTIKQKKKKKPFTVVDFQRERLLKDDYLLENEGEHLKNSNMQEPNKLSYIQEQQKLKEDLKKALNKSASEDADDSVSESEEDKGGLFKVREKNKDELAKEQEDYIKWLAGQKKDNIGPDSETLLPLKNYWTSEKITKEDKFLRDYILERKYVENSTIPAYEDIVGLSDDEKDVEQQDEYENKYNFRFEEPDSEFIKRYPRNLEDTVRVAENKRKEKRKEREDRKKREKELKMKELKELQSIKKREIEEKLMLLKHVSGNDEFQLNGEDLYSDFNPSEHDKQMAQMFDNNYYGIDEGDQKPEFPDIDEEIGLENWDNFDKSKVIDEDLDSNGGEIEQQHDANQHCEDDDFNMDCDFDPQTVKRQQIQEELITMTKGRKKRRKLSRLAQLVKQEKPAFNPEEKSYEEYLDEYYKLDYEDIIGDQPCRFKYTECVPNDFGLTVEEILLASNKELNQWASLKKTMQNRPKNVEINDVEKYNRRRNNIDLKRKIFSSIYGEKNEEDEKIDEELAPTVEKIYEEKRKSKEMNTILKKDKKLKSMDISSNEADIKLQSNENYVERLEKGKNGGPSNDVTNQTSLKRKLDESEIIQNLKSFKNRRTSGKPQNLKHKKNTHKKKFKKPVISEERLKAFGINPKKFKNKLKYGKNNKFNRGKWKTTNND